MAETERKNKPIAGGLWGILLGLGLALLAINSKIISLSIVSIVIVVVIGVAIGVLWGLFGPARKPKGAPPTPRREPRPAEIGADEPTADEPTDDAPEEATEADASAEPSDPT